MTDHFDRFIAKFAILIVGVYFLLVGSVLCFVFWVVIKLLQHFGVI